MERFILRSFQDDKANVVTSVQWWQRFSKPPVLQFKPPTQRWLSGAEAKTPAGKDFPTGVTH
ncbi:hypothetical protein [Chryseobacterium taichungense]|uniref:hypothetical protein n=1 Tax=Chryseobacterium taichungense TaxID=295069 RepID=UPI000B7EF335|nr:hypothetical protein [Chryseobacterium taichungense]